MIVIITDDHACNRIRQSEVRKTRHNNIHSVHIIDNFLISLFIIGLLPDSFNLQNGVVELTIYAVGLGSCLSKSKDIRVCKLLNINPVYVNVVVQE